MKAREEIIENYIAGYNCFDIERMIQDIDSAVEFKNIENEVVTIKLYGYESFKQQAAQTAQFFSERSISINSFRHQYDSIEVEIEYRARVAVDMPNGWKAGQAVRLAGTSFFTFNDHNKITSITDISSPLTHT